MENVIYSDLHALALQEPWRLGVGHVNALDPTWMGEDPQLCQESIWWEPGTGWWMCCECGHLSWLHTTLHLPAIKPWRYFLESLGFYLSQRAQQKTSLSTTVNQALFISGMAIRYAGAHQPDEIGQYARNLVTG